MYGKVINHSSAKELGAFMKETIAKDTVVRTDEWAGYKPLKKDFANLSHTSSGKKGGNFPDLHRVIMGFKGWLRGMHHHANHLQAYINEYTYRYNRNFMKANIFDNLLDRMMNAKPYTYKMIIS